MEVLQYENLDLHSLITPVNVDTLESLLVKSKYDKNETEFWWQGFRNGFSIGYQRECEVELTAPNLKLRVGNETILWNKVMKEVKMKRYAGPFPEIPYKYDYIQSPIGLVPKDGGRECRLIFHLSYPRNGRDSVNTNTPTDQSKVKYKEFDEAVRMCMDEGRFLLFIEG